MHLLNFLSPTLLVASGAEALRSAPKVKLSNVQSLTLRKDLETSHRRVSAIPQLRCIGGSARGLYNIDVMRCKNAGADYDENNIQWTCTASLPEEFKLGSTDVNCEGYDSPDDPYILKGSCGVEYRLILTDKGHEKFGKGRGRWGDEDDYGRDGPKSFGEKVAGALFWMAFIGIAVWIVYSAFIARQQGPAGPGVGGGNRPGWGGGGGGGGWGGNDDSNDDPPPPYYDSRPGMNKKDYGSTQPGQQGWRPGFWSGALGGAAAGWAANRMGNRGNQTTGNGWGNNRGNGWGNGGGSSWDNGEGSSGSSPGSSFSSTRHESTGFGSTSRR